MTVSNSNTQHTPGPWYVGLGADGFPIICTAKNKYTTGQGIAFICSRRTETRHNANLISVAPDMLQALYAAEIALSHSVEGQDSPYAAQSSDPAAVLSGIRAVLDKTTWGNGV